MNSLELLVQCIPEEIELDDIDEPTPIPGFDDYGATRDGQIWSRKKGDWWSSLALSEIAPSSYLKVNLSVDGVQRTFRVAHLVARTFIGQRPAALDGQRIDINHKDLNKQNNSDWNLEYVTQLDNINHALKAHGFPGVKTATDHLSEMLRCLRTVLRREHRRMPISPGHCCGVRMRNHKLSNDDVRLMRALAGDHSLAELGRRFGVSKNTVWRVIRFM